MGIRGMRARVQALGGSIAIGPSSRGFTVRARFPLSEPC
jgi:signal transduction histidine kinase